MLVEKIQAQIVADSVVAAEMRLQSATSRYLETVGHVVVRADVLKAAIDALISEDGQDVHIVSWMNLMSGVLKEQVVRRIADEEETRIVMLLTRPVSEGGK